MFLHFAGFKLFVAFFKEDSEKEGDDLPLFDSSDEIAHRVNFSRLIDVFTGINALHALRSPAQQKNHEDQCRERVSDVEDQK